MSLVWIIFWGGIFASLLHAQTPPQQAPGYVRASQTAHARLAEIVADAAAPAERVTSTREIHAPLSTKDRVHDVPTTILPQLADLGPRPASLDVPRAVAPTSPQMLTGFRALFDDNSSIPPDTHGAVGPNHVVTALNSEIQFQRRDGTVLNRLTIEAFFARLGPFTGSVFDPRAAYDVTSARWIVVALSDPRIPGVSSLLIATSITADPTGEWNFFRINSDVADNAWIDYPNIGVTADRVVISANLFQVDAFFRTQIWVFTKTELFAGTASARTFRERLGTAVPVSSPDQLARIPLFSQSAAGGSIIVSEVAGPIGTETFTPSAVILRAGDTWANSFTGGDFLPQQGSTNLIDAGDARIQNCLARGTFVWCAHHVFLPASLPDRVAVQFYQMDLATYAIRQVTRLADSTAKVHYAYPSIAVNRNNDVLVGFSRFSADRFAEAAYALRLGSDPAGDLQVDTLIKRGEAPYRKGTSRNRWGDYSMTVVDPVDDTSFWTVQEYAGSTTSGGPNRWSTWWAQITPLAAGTAPCTYELSSTALTAAPGRSTVQVNVTARAGCRWMAAADIGWLSVTDGAMGSGNGVVTIAVESNILTSVREGILTIAGQRVTLQQEAASVAAPPQLAVTSFTAVPSGSVGEPFTGRVTIQNVSPVASGAFRLGFYFSRTQPVTVNDARAPVACTFANGLAAGDQVTCSGSTLSSPANLNPGTYFVAAIADDRSETTMTDRSRATRVADTGVIALAPSPLAPEITAAGIAHGATAVASPVAPGLNVVFYGNRLGPADLRGLELDSTTGRVATLVGGTRVLFDNVPAPIHYVSAGQTSVFVPYSVAGKSTVTVQAQLNGRLSAPVTVPVATVLPGIYSLNFTGRGQGAIVNATGQVNGAANPAPRGSVVLIYGAGAGQLVPNGVDGEVIGAPLPAFAARPVEVTIGGRPARVIYAGPAGALISGVVQLNVEVPADVTPGAAVPVELRIGGVAAPSGVTMAVQ